MSLLLLKVAAVLYMLVAVVGLVQLIKPREGGERLNLIGLLVAMLFHALAIGGRTVDVGAFPVANMHDALSLFAFVAVVVGAAIAWRAGVPQAAPLTAMLVTVLVWIAIAIQPLDRVPEPLRSAWLPAHIAFAFLGDAAIAVAGIVSVVYLVQDHRLKARKSKGAMKKMGSGVHKLPALEMLDKVSVQLLEWGFPMMTLGIITGALYSNEIWNTYWTWDPRNMVGVLTWALYAVLLHVRLTIGWRGRKLAILTLVGVTVTLIAFVGLGVAGIGLHGKEILS
jgi:cytochrome c-type biogenesis protein CcsB